MILDAAAPVFLRFGYKKASMDDIARAVGLSRQSLYAHFETKEGLFKGVVLHILNQTRTAAMTALGQNEKGIEDRLLAMFEAVHAHVIGQIGAEQMTELFEDASSLVGPVFAELERDLVSEIARLLAESQIADAWHAVDLSAQALAENLYSVSIGLRHRVATVGAYRKAMGAALRIVCRGGVDCIGSR